jgi:hypothetical protein
MGKKINIRPTTSVYATYKNIRYNPWTAIAEFVDNSTQSYFDYKRKLEETKYWKGLDIQIDYSTKNGKPDELIIKDNAYGMCFEDFKRAIILDSKPKFANRGEFGMGLKTAACWFGLNWSVESTELGSGIRYFAEVDVDSLQKYPKEEIEVSEEICSPKEHGTVIRIWNLNRCIAGRQVGKLKQQLSGIYRTDLRSGEIKIYYNGDGLSYQDPAVLTEKLPDGSTLEWKKPIEYKLRFDEREYSVQGFIAIRETASTSDAGFALLRYGRVIVGGYENNYRPEEIFEKSNSFVYQRLYGEINLDNWPVTQTKDGFDWFNGLEDALVETLREESLEYIKKATEYRKKGQEKINRSFETVLDKFERQGLIQEVQIETIQEPISPLEVDSVKQGVQDFMQPDNRKEHLNAVPTSRFDETLREVFSFRCNGIDYRLHILISTDSEFESWLRIRNLNNVENQYEVEWNLSHPFFKPIIEEEKTIEVFKGFILAFVLSELEVTRMSGDEPLPHSEIRHTMNKWLKEVTRR